MEDSRVTLIIYDIQGKEIDEILDNEFIPKGKVQYGFDTGKYDLSSGVYFYRVTAKSEVNDKNIY